MYIMKTIIIILTLMLTNTAMSNNHYLYESIKREIKGQILEEKTNLPVSFATLSVVTPEDTTKAIALLACDIDGNFSISLEENKEYIFQVSSIGKLPARKQVSLPAGTETWDIGKIKLTDDAQLLNEIIVRAQKPLVKADIDKLIYSVEDDKDASVNSVLDIMRKVPMITVDSDDNIQVQGNSNFLIYVNGKPSSLMSNNPSDVLKSLPASSVKNIEVITEPGARYDAEGVSGVINIITAQRTIDGYTGAINGEASVMKEFGAGTFISLKANKFGLTANYNYGNEQEPLTDMELIRSSDSAESGEILKQTGTKRENEKIHRGFLEASYEIDSLNLISIGANIFRKRQHEYSDYLVEMLNRQNQPVYSYNRNSYNYPTFGTIEMNADYQHETRKKGEILTVSYRFTNEPNSNENKTYITPIQNYSASDIWDSNYAKTDEHTFQIDYILPIWKIHEIEMGTKYILRLSESEVIRRTPDTDSGNWIAQSEQYTDFKHNQHIYALYLGDTFRWKDIGIKAGIRAEGTLQQIDNKTEPEKNFSTNFIDIVPNFSLSYSITEYQQLRAGYNMRIRRAGIDRLNPYVDETDPLNISFGNPKLNSEKSHRVNLNYGLFTRTFNMNVNLSYSFVNNSIEAFTYMDNEKPNTSITTYGNIGKRNETHLSMYATWMPAKWIRLFLNNGISYVNLKSDMSNLANKGFNGRIFGGMQITLPKELNLSLNAGYIMPKLSLQGHQASFMTHDITLNKELFNRKLTVSLYCKSPFFRVWQQENKTQTETFNIINNEWKVMRDFGIKLSYRFGNMLDSIKKIKRGIINDDKIE